MPFRVVEVQPTPNPNAVKFILDKPVAEHPTSFFSPEQAQNHSLAARLFEIDGVSSVLLLGDFITINKRPEAAWTKLKQRVSDVLNSDCMQ